MAHQKIAQHLKNISHFNILAYLNSNKKESKWRERIFQFISSHKLCIRGCREKSSTKKDAHEVFLDFFTTLMYAVGFIDIKKKIAQREKSIVSNIQNKIGNTRWLTSNLFLYL
jgi:hypothetical protein